MPAPQLAPQASFRKFADPTGGQPAGPRRKLSVDVVPAMHSAAAAPHTPLLKAVSGTFPVEPLPERDPLASLVEVLLDTQAVDVSTLADAVQWATHFEPACGALDEFLDMYPTVFAVSPVTGLVRFRAAVHAGAASRRTVGGAGGHSVALSQRIGHVACCSVCQRLDLPPLLTFYRNRGYDASLEDGVLHVHFPHTFDLLAFANGAVVWWGRTRDHWIVEDDFIAAHSPIRRHMHRRHDPQLQELFPVWFTYEVSASVNVEEAFTKSLLYDHFVLPAVGADRRDVFGDSALEFYAASAVSQRGVMKAVSCALSEVVKLELLEFNARSLLDQAEDMTRWLHPNRDKAEGSLTEMTTETREIFCCLGRLNVGRQSLINPRDQPLFVYEHAATAPYYEWVQEHCATVTRCQWVESRAETVYDTLATLARDNHSQGMAWADWFLIGLLFFDAVALLTRLIVVAYFRPTEW